MASFDGGHFSKQQFFKESIVVNLRGEIGKVDELQQQRLWNTLDSIFKKLENVDSKLDDVVRLEERMDSFKDTLARYGKSLDDHEQRIRRGELWRADNSNRENLERLIKHLMSKIEELEGEINDLKNTKLTWTGFTNAIKPVVKWVFALVGAWLAFKLWGGGSNGG